LDSRVGLVTELSSGNARQKVVTSIYDRQII